jgi:hypothetical protein
MFSIRITLFATPSFMRTCPLNKISCIQTCAKAEFAATRSREVGWKGAQWGRTLNVAEN